MQLGLAEQVLWAKTESKRVEKEAEMDLDTSTAD
jgi:hypothetical protein